MMVQAWKDKEGKLHETEEERIYADRLREFKEWYSLAEATDGMGFDLNTDIEYLYKWLRMHRSCLIHVLNNSAEGDR